MMGLMSKYLFGGAALLCVVLGVVAGILHAQRNEARAEAENWKTQVGVLEDANAKWAAASALQDAAIKAWQAAADRRGKDAQAGAAKAAAEQKPHEDRAARIIRVPITTEECTTLQAQIDEARR